MISYNNNTRIAGISIHFFPKDVAEWPNGRVSIFDIQEILLLDVVGLTLRTVFEDGCYEHIPRTN